MLPSEIILEATDGGKDIILSLFPESEVSFRKKGNFRIRKEDKSPSAGVFKSNNKWMIKDFGSGDSYDAISLYAFVNNISYEEAIKILITKYSSGNFVEERKPTFEKRKATKEEKNGEKYFKYHDQLLPQHLKVFGEITTLEACEVAKLKACFEYTIIKENLTTNESEALVFKSNENYPILVYDYGDWQKIYQPYAQDKANRFRYAGEKPVDFIFGLDHLKDLHTDFVNQKVEQADRDNENLSEKDIKNIKLPLVVIASGDSDGINFLSLGYPTVWANSETISDLSFSVLITKLKKYAHKIVRVPDLDEAGIESARKTARTHLELYTCYLPEKIKSYKDHRGNKKKDFKDFVGIRFAEIMGKSEYNDPEVRQRAVSRAKDHILNEVDVMLNNSIRCQFWKAIYVKGRFSKYQFDYESCIEFLRCSNFFRYKDKFGEYFCLRIGHIIRKVNHNDIRSFLINYLRERNYNQDLRNFILERKAISKDSLFADLPYHDIQFIRAGKDFQILHFLNVSWKITKNGIEKIDPKKQEYNVWEEDIIQHEAYQKESEFSWFFEKDLNDHPFLKSFPSTPQCNYLEYLMLSSNIFWKKSPNYNALDIKDKHEVAHIFLNKIYTIGYMMHAYKDRSKPFAPWVMEHEIITNGESNGGTGKSVFVEGISAIQNTKMINARPKDFQDKWPYDKVRENTRTIWFDDCHKYLKLDYFFSNITGNLTVEDKGGNKITMAYEEAGKHIFTSNYPPREADGSTLRRLLFVLVSDFFHSENEEKGYSTYAISDYFKKNLFSDFTAEEWNYYFNTIAACIQFYFQQDKKLDPPMENVKKRNLVAVMGENFKDWADAYFDTESKNINCYKQRDEVVKLSPKETTASFTKAMKAWCKFYGYEYNPTDIAHYSDATKCYMIRPTGGTQYSGAVAHIYVKTSSLDIFKNEETLF